MIRLLAAFLVAVVAVVIVGAAALSWFDQAGYLAASGAGASLSLPERLSWFAATLYGLVVSVNMYPALVTIGLLVAFAAAGLVQNVAPNLRFWWFAGAGAVALLLMVISLKLTLGLKVLPGARTDAGMFAQAFAGLIGGAVFALLTRPRRFRH